MREYTHKYGCEVNKLQAFTLIGICCYCHLSLIHYAVELNEAPPLR